MQRRPEYRSPSCINPDAAAMPVPTSDIAIVDVPTDMHARNKVAVVRFDRSFHLMATTLVTGGEVIVSIEGIDARRPRVTSVQVVTDRHL